MRKKSERQSKSEEVVRERERERARMSRESLREICGVQIFFFLNITKRCNFVNIIRVN